MGFDRAATASPPLATSPSPSCTARERTGLLRGGGVGGGLGGDELEPPKRWRGAQWAALYLWAASARPEPARRALRWRRSRVRATAKGQASEHADAPGVFLGAGDLPPLRHIPHSQRTVDATAQQQGPIHATMPRAATTRPRQPRHGAQVAVQLRRRSLLLRAVEAPDVHRPRRLGAGERARRERHAVHRPRASPERRRAPRAEGPLAPPAARVPQPGGAVPAAARDRTAAQRDAVHVRQRLVACQLTAGKTADDPRVHPELVEVSRLGAPAGAAQRLAPRLPQPPADRLDDPQGAEAARLHDQPELVVGEDQPEEIRACRLSFGPRDGPHWRAGRWHAPAQRDGWPSERYGAEICAPCRLSRYPPARRSQTAARAPRTTPGCNRGAPAATPRPRQQPASTTAGAGQKRKPEVQTARVRAPRVPQPARAFRRPWGVGPGWRVTHLPNSTMRTLHQLFMAGEPCHIESLISLSILSDLVTNIF